MPHPHQPADRRASALVTELLVALQRDRLIPRFVDSYVEEHRRYALQAHPARYRELLALLTREALIALTLRALEGAANPGASPKPRLRKAPHSSGRTFRRDFLTALAHQQGWSAGDSLEFQADLRLYEDLLARRPASRRAPKALEAADHPFVDRAAILLDPSFLEQARVAATRALLELDRLADEVTSRVLARPASSKLSSR
jgi:hypothetical protein